MRWTINLIYTDLIHTTRNTETIKPTLDTLSPVLSRQKSKLGHTVGQETGMLTYSWYSYKLW